MTWEQFMQGITILYAFGMKEKGAWELQIWFRALKDELGFGSYEQSCLHLCRTNLKFWETDNIPAQLIGICALKQKEIGQKLIAQRVEDDQARRDRERQEAIDSYGSEEERLQCVANFKKMNRETFRTMPR